MTIAGNDLLSQIENENPKLGQYLRNYLLPAIQTTATNAAVATSGNVAAPAPIQAINVVTAGETVHVSHVDNSPVQKGVNYFTEIGVNDPHFTRPIVKHHGTSRTPEPFTLPTKDSTGAAISYYFQGYSQYPGSPPSAPVKFNNGQAVTLGGTTALSLLPSTGSGTASGSGTQGGSGFGKSQVRLAITSKRSVS